MKYKAIITDVDGTIMENKVNGIPSLKITSVLKKAKKKVHVGLATARSLADSSHIFDHIELTGPSILLGGGQIVDAGSRKVLIENVLSLNAVTQIINILQKAKKKFFIDEPERKIAYTSHYIPKNPINIYVPELSINEADVIHDTLRSIPLISITKATDWGNNKFALGISHISSTKQEAVLKVAQLLNISTHEIIGIGDGYNDFPLLMACGLKVAMGNAVPELKAIADYIAPSVEDDGVANVIEKFVLNPS